MCKSHIIHPKGHSTGRAAQSGWLQCNFLIAALKYLSQTSESIWEQHSTFPLLPGSRPTCSWGFYHLAWCPPSAEASLPPEVRNKVFLVCLEPNAVALGHLQEWAIPEALPGILSVGLGTLWGVKFVLQCVSSEQGPPCFVTGHTMPVMAAPCLKVRAELGATGAAFPAFCTSPGLCSLLGKSLCPLSSSGLELEVAYPSLVRLQAFLCFSPCSAAFWGKASSTFGSSGCSLPFGEAAGHISGCLLAGSAPGMQTLPLSLMPPTHCPHTCKPLPSARPWAGAAPFPEGFAASCQGQDLPGLLWTIFPHFPCSMSQ